MTVRDSFTAAFGEGQARAIETAAEQHNAGRPCDRGTDPFKWALAMCIGYECITSPLYRDYHEIRADTEQLRQWVISEGHLDSHDGDVDFLALYCGVYKQWMPAKQGEP